MSWRTVLMDEAPLLFRKSLATRIGLNEAIAVQQLHFVLTHIDSRAVEIEGVRWVKAPISYWAEQFPFWSEATIKRVFAGLKETGLVESSRGREANVYTLNYAAIAQIAPEVGSDCADETAQVDPCLPIGEVEKKKKTSPPDGAATLFPTPEPKSVKDGAAAQGEELVNQLWDAYVATFGDRMRIKTLTPPRAGTLRKALKAVGWDVDLCKRAIHGLKSYRDSHPQGSKDVSPSVIFETGPHSGRSLTDQIEWWADQSSSETAASLPNVPSVMHARVNDRKLAVVKMYQQPDNGSLRERGEQALAWLRSHVKIEPVVTDGKVTEWREIA